MSIYFLVTTRAEIVEQKREELKIDSVIMIDGTVPNWTSKENDFIFDHHKPGGAKTQIEDILKQEELFLEKGKRIIFVTTQVDADAICGSVFLYCNYLTEREHIYISSNDYNFQQKAINLAKLLAISYDCDHLYVPDTVRIGDYICQLKAYRDFAAQCVAALKFDSDTLIEFLELPKDRKAWSIEQKEDYATLAFSRGFDAILKAVKGEQLYPGEQGEAKEYWEKVEQFTQLLKEQKRITLYRNCWIIDTLELQGQYIDPRCALRVIQEMDVDSLPITLTQRSLFVENVFKGYSYTIGCIPWHENTEELDYTQRVFKELTIAEATIRNPELDLAVFAHWGEKDFASKLGFNPWGGRATVGGSGWNTPSELLPQEVIDIVIECLYV